MKFLARTKDGWCIEFYADCWATAEKVCAANGWVLDGEWVEDVCI